jgi:hypothetical protein
MSGHELLTPIRPPQAEPPSTAAPVNARTAAARSNSRFQTPWWPGIAWRRAFMLVAFLSSSASFTMCAVGSQPAELADQKTAEPSVASKESVDRGREALGRMSFAPWYDAEQDELKRVNVRPPAKWPWFEWIADFFRSLEGPDWDGSWLSTLFGGLGTFATVVVWSILILALLLLAYVLIKGFMWIKWRNRQDSDEDDSEEDRLRQARVDELPMQLTAPRGDFLAEARRRYEAGDFSGAIIYLFSHELLQLDRHRRIQLERGKTNRQYLREVRGEPFLATALSRTMVAFEDVFFGHHPLDRSRFEACWQEVDEFHRRLPEGAAP